ncbi:hypothetical protein LINGRAHAP2_LOCUS10203 [Linum grandiflorum]
MWKGCNSFGFKGQNGKTRDFSFHHYFLFSDKWSL